MASISNIFTWIMQVLVDHFGYRNAIEMKDGLLFLSGVLLSAMIQLFVLSWASKYIVHRVSDNECCTTITQLEKNGKNYIIVTHPAKDPHPSFPKRTGLMVFLLVFRLFPRIAGKKKRRIYDNKRTRITFWTIVVCLTIFITSSLYLGLHTVLTDKDKSPDSKNERVHVLYVDE